MKPIYLSCFLLASLGSSSYAQLPVDSVLDPNQIEDQIQDQVQDQVQDQIINSGVIENQVIDTQILDGQILDDQILGGDLLDGDALGAGALDQDLISGTLGDLDEAGRLVRDALEPIIDAVPLDALAKTLPILTRTGETAFVDVEVENGWRAVEHEWLIMLDKADVKLLQPLQADIIEQTNFADLDMALVRFRVPAQWDSAAAIKQRSRHLHEQLDRNHIYGAQAEIPAASTTTPASFIAICDAPVKVGMIDTAINTEHPAFAPDRIIPRDFLGEQFDAPRAHGTAVAGLLVGRGATLQPLLPKAQLYAASVFYPRNQYSQGATMMDLVRALNWLLGEKVSAINMSLAGPDNQILRNVIIRVTQQGIAIVAAAGNEGPASPPMYPAAYADVIAVTAVDREQRIYRWANRGDYIDFAALGVSVTTARSDGGFGRETGTSIAAPLVSAFVACERLMRNEKSVALIEGLAGKVTDLGAPGRDPIFGFGLLEAAAIKAEQ